VQKFARTAEISISKSRQEGSYFLCSVFTLYIMYLCMYSILWFVKSVSNNCSKFDQPV